MAGNSELEMVIRNKFQHSRYYTSSGYMQVRIGSELKLQSKPGENKLFRCSKAANPVASDGDLTEIQTHPCFYVCPGYLQE